jgi:hypothetical protein
VQTDFFYFRLKFAIAVLAEIKTATETMQTDLITHGLDTVKAKRRLRMLSQLGKYQQQIFSKLPHWYIESREDLQRCLALVRRELEAITQQSS